MNKRDFFLEAMRNRRYHDKRWIIAAFSLTEPKSGNPFEDMRPWDILPLDPIEHDRSIAFIDGESGTPLDLEDFSMDPGNPQPPYRPGERLTLNKGDLPNVVSKVETSYGNVLVNCLLCIYPFGDKIPFQNGDKNGKITVKALEAIIEKGLKDGSLTIEEYNRYRRGTGLLDGLTQLVVPSATRKSMTRHPDTEKVRARLLEENKDRLHDPAVVAKIDAQLVELDKEYLKDDPSMGFYIKGKSLTNVRKKAHSMYGIETAFGDGATGTLLERSLSEGWDIEKLPEMANSLREGSFDRGASTALGGEAVKFIYRVTQNALLEADDCGTKLGIDIVITKDNQDMYLGNNIIDAGKVVQLTTENIKQYYNKPVPMRSPLFCKVSRDSSCKTCIGGRYAEHPTGLSSAMAGIGSTLMSIFMASTHVSEVKVAKWDWKNNLS